MSGTPHAETCTEPDRTSLGAALARRMMASSIPCAIIDRKGVVIDASAALLTIMPSVIGQSVRTAFHIDPVVLFAPASRTRPVHGKYMGTSGGLVPAVLHAMFDMPEQADALLIALSDGAPFRHAEARRFDTTPYTVLRVTNGRIQYRCRLQPLVAQQDLDDADVDLALQQVRGEGVTPISSAT